MIEDFKKAGVGDYRWAYYLLCASMFGVAFSLPLGRTLGALSLIMMIAESVRLRRRPVLGLATWCWLVLLLLAVVAAKVGINPERSFHKLHKLFWFALIPVAATVTAGRAERIGPLLRSFAVGCGVLGLKILLWRPVEAWQAVKATAGTDHACSYLWAITDLGSMTHGQTLMIGIVALAAVMIADYQTGRRISGWYYGLMGLLVAALVLNLKRGSWFCTLLVLGIFVAAKLKLRYLALMIVIAVGILALPPVWCRICALRSEFDCSRGGRIVMWTKIAPPLIKEHPWGIGYRALTAETMQGVAREQGVTVEKQRDHLHSNPVQVLVSLGWAGLGVYILWMVGGIVGGVSLLRGLPVGSAARTEVFGMVLMLTGLILNGLVEYNLGDAELVLPYAVLLGCLGGVERET